MNGHLSLGVFAKLRRATIKFVRTVRTELGYHQTEFHEILYFSIFRKFVEKIQVSLKFDKNNGYFTRKTLYIYDSISLNSSWNENCFRQRCRENQNIHLMFKSFVYENYSVY